MEQRLVDLETKIAFQENAISQLSDVIVDQQRQIDQLRKELEALHLQVLALAPSLIAGQGEETAPPHY